MKVFIVNGGKEYAEFLGDVEFVKSPTQADVVIFPEGPDVSPSLYNAPRERTTKCSGSRDSKDVAVFKSLTKDQIAVGFVRGGQLLNVLNGGDLIQSVRWGTPTEQSYDIILINGNEEKMAFPKIQKHKQALYPWNISSEYFKMRGYSRGVEFFSEENRKLFIMSNHVYGNPEIVTYNVPNKPRCIAVQFRPTIYKNELLNYPIKFVKDLIDEMLRK